MKNIRLLIVLSFFLVKFNVDAQISYGSQQDLYGLQRISCAIQQKQSDSQPIFRTFEQTSDNDVSFVRSKSQKGVELSTDILALALPVATLTGVLIERDWKGLVQGAYTFAATFGATMILKYTVKEERPDHSNFHSFPSAHTSASFATAAFLQRRYGWKFGAPAYAIATYVGWGRVFSKKHHWWDVVAGAAIGAGSAYIFTRPWAREHNLNIGVATLSDPIQNDPIPTVTCSFNF